MRVSVVIPCHDARPYLAQAVGSALAQGPPPHEVIVVDDGSTDGSGELAGRLAAASPGVVRFFAEPSGNAAATRNLGALAATGEALMFLDADDVLGPGTLAALSAALPVDGAAAGPWLRLEQDGGQWVARPPTCVPRRPDQNPLDAWLRGWYCPPCAVLWTREAFEHVGRWDEHCRLNQDGDLMMRALAADVPLNVTERGVSFYRRPPAGETSLSTAGPTRAGLESRLRVIGKIAWHLQDNATLRRHAAAVRQAYHLVARDARAPFPDLVDRALDAARTLAGPRWRRALRRLVPTRAEVAAPPLPPDAAAWLGRPVTFGDDPPLADAPAPPAAIDRPAVTVIIPTYNRAGLIARSAGSVLAQDFGDFELLVVDDGSTDNIAGAVAALGDSRVRLIRQPRNMGVSAARNRGLREARGESVAFLDSDDEWLPGKLARQVERLRGLPDDVALVYTAVENLYEGKPDGRRDVWTPAHRGHIHDVMLLLYVLHGATVAGLMRRSAVASAGFFDEHIPAIEDWEFFLRVTRFFAVEPMPEMLARYHDVGGIERKSLDFAENQAARDYLFRKHRPELRRRGLAAAFLLESARRCVLPPNDYLADARRLAARAVREEPTNRVALGALRRLMTTGRMK